MIQFHIKKGQKGRIYRKEWIKISDALWHIVSVYMFTCTTQVQSGGDARVTFQPKVSLQFVCARCMRLNTHCRSTFLIISSRLWCCGNRQSSTNKYFARLCRSYPTHFWGSELQVQLSMLTGVIPLTVVLTRQ